MARRSLGSWLLGADLPLAVHARPETPEGWALEVVHQLGLLLPLTPDRLLVHAYGEHRIVHIEDVVCAPASPSFESLPPGVYDHRFERYDFLARAIGELALRLGRKLGENWAEGVLLDGEELTIAGCRLAVPRERLLYDARFFEQARESQLVQLRSEAAAQWIRNLSPRTQEWRASQFRITLRDHRAFEIPAVPLGTFDGLDRTWRWSWANETLPSWCTSALRAQMEERASSPGLVVLGLSDLVTTKRFAYTLANVATHQRHSTEAVVVLPLPKQTRRAVHHRPHVVPDNIRIARASANAGTLQLFLALELPKAFPP